MLQFFLLIIKYIKLGHYQNDIIKLCYKLYSKFMQCLDTACAQVQVMFISSRMVSVIRTAHLLSAPSAGYCGATGGTTATGKTTPQTESLVSSFYISFTYMIVETLKEIFELKQEQYNLLGVPFCELIQVKTIEMLVTYPEMHTAHLHYCTQLLLV